jgi:GT2 family glycosyltransferase
VRPTNGWHGSHSYAEPSIPDVSVVIPLFNRANLIPFTLESLRAEHHPGVRLELIVVDDGSTDSGGEIAAQVLPGTQVLRTPRTGASKARNVGLAAARAEAIFFLDSDDLVERGFFSQRLKALAQHPAADAVYGPFEFFNGDGAFSDDLVKPRHASYPLELHIEREAHLWRLLRGWYIPPPALLWRAAAVRRLGGYDEALRINQDVDLLFRALVTGAGIAGIDGPRALYRDHAAVGRQGAVGDDIGKATDLLMLRRRFIGDLENAGLFGVAARQAMGTYCFHQWFSFRKTMPAIADDFYRLSRSLYPNLRLPGRWPLRLLSATVGARRAVVLADVARRATSRMPRPTL